MTEASNAMNYRSNDGEHFVYLLTATIYLTMTTFEIPKTMMSFVDI